MVACLVVFFALAAASAAGPQKVLSLDDYPRWNRIVSTALSADGRWMAYAYRPNDGDETLFLREVDTDRAIKVPGGASPAFSEDGRWAACLVNLPKKEADALRKARKPVPRKIELVNLANGERTAFENSSTFIFSADSAFIAVRRDKAADAKQDGTDLYLRHLESGVVQNIGNVSAYGFNKPGTRLAYLVDAADNTGNGAYLLNLRSRSIAALDSAAADYAQLTWSEDGQALAVVRGTKKPKAVQKVNVLLAFLDLDQAKPRRVAYDAAADARFPKAMVLSEYGSLLWSRDKSRIFCGIKEQEAEPEKSDEPVANVDVWHWKDERVQSIQMVRAESDRRATYRSAVHLDGPRFVQLATEDMPSVTLSDDGKVAIGRLDKPYRMEISWGGSRADVYAIDTSTGDRKLVVSAINRTLGLSPDARWFLYQKDRDIWAYDLQAATVKNLSKPSGVNFVDEDDDHPYEKPTYGVAGWTLDGKAVLVNHKFDVWSLPLEGGAATNLTGGAGTRDQVVFRYLRLDPEEKAIDTSKPMLLSAQAQWTKQSGYFRLEPGGGLTRLVMADRAIGRPTKAKKADRLLFTSETFVEFPDYYVAGLDFASPKKITDANPQQAEYAWGRRVLVEYKTAKGVRLQGTLALPANYEQGKRYPMLVYFYEKMSDQHHRYSMPVWDDRPHMSLYASDGYLVLQPDVVYTTGHPGDSALDCVTSAVKKVIELGYADPKRIGLQGHSWGGYQSSFMVTQTDMFAAVVTGAPPTNLVSFYNELYKSTGTVQHGITEVGQVRMGVMPWQNMPLYESQSAIFQAPRIKTPFLILHGTDDGAVDWHQGLELYNAARRLGKQVILLSYPGEQHHLTKVENQKDFLRRMKQYFDHYLKGAPAAKWMTDGVPFLKKAAPAPTVPTTTER